MIVKDLINKLEKLSEEDKNKRVVIEIYDQSDFMHVDIANIYPITPSEIDYVRNNDEVIFIGSE